MSNRLVRVAEETRDPQAERDGVWAEYLAANGETFRVKLRRAGASNPEFHAMSEKLTRKYRRGGKDIDELPIAQQHEMTRKLYAATVLVDWDEAAFGCPFSISEAESAMDADPEFRGFCVREALAASNYNKAAIAATSGN